MTEKRFVKVYCCGDTGLLDKEKEEWFVENINSVFDLERNWNDVLDKLNEVAEENAKLKSENKRLTDKLNKTALELVDGVISQGKATEISEMSYREFLDFRAKNGKPMELKK